jgi:GABA(A) receptor-associated protein
MAARIPFKVIHSKEIRKTTCDNLRKKHPTRIPAIIEPAGIDTPDIEKFKFLIPNDCQIGMFIYEVRKCIRHLKPQEALFIFVNNTLIPSGSLMSQIYNTYKDKEDGFLYLTYSLENTFG